MFYAPDPDTNKKSVSLTLLLTSFLILCILGVLEAVGKVKSTSVFLELTLITTSLYFGRRFQWRGQVIESSDPKKEEQK